MSGCFQATTWHGRLGPEANAAHGWPGLLFTRCGVNRAVTVHCHRVVARLARVAGSLPGDDVFPYTIGHCGEMAQQGGGSGSSPV
jgi:hypothetical protein